MATCKFFLNVIGFFFSIICLVYQLLVYTNKVVIIKKTGHLNLRCNQILDPLLGPRRKRSTGANPIKIFTP